MSARAPLIMGILNLTPDSFSDGGLFNDVEAALQHASQMMYEGADIIDIGGESTRPGAGRVAADEQIARVVEVIRAVSEIAQDEVRISIDTTLSKVAAAALDAGASIINDVSAGGDDPEILALAAERGATLVLMHMRGTPATMQINPVYDDVVEDVRAYLMRRVEMAERAGVRRRDIIIDPGIGFGKDQSHNMRLIASLGRFVDTGIDVLLGASRKRFMGAICQGAEARQLTGATCATTVIGVNAGVRVFRVHDVRPNRQAADLAFAIEESEWGV